MTLLVDVNYSESQEVSVRNWKTVCSLVGDAVSGAKYATFWHGSHLPPAACLPRGMGQSAAGQLFSGMVPSFVLGTGQQCLRLGLFTG